MLKFQYLLFVLKRSYIFYYVIDMTVPSRKLNFKAILFLNSELLNFLEVLHFAFFFKDCEILKFNF